MSSSKALLQAELESILSDVDKSVTAAQKAQQLSAAIDNYIMDIFMKLSATGTASPPSATCAIPPGGFIVG